MKLVIGAGGTGGHIIPAIAVARELSAQGWQVEFIGNRDGMEKSIVANNGFAFHPINVQKIYRKITPAHLKFPFLFINSLLLARKYLKQIRPEAVLCTGGFVSGPVALAAILCKTPLYFQDGNSYPGLTTRLLARFTNHIFIASEVAKKYLTSADCLLTGNPILPYTKLELSTVNWAELNLTATSTKLFIIGGSQGSAIINRVVGQCIPELLERGIEIIWQTGKNHKADIQQKFGNLKGIHIFDFTDRMSFFYQISDMAVSRAGALSIAELEEHRIPAIYIPLPTAAENHQYINAMALVKQGKGIIQEQSKLSKTTLMESITKLSDGSSVFQMNLSQASASRATQTICEIITRESKN